MMKQQWAVVLTSGNPDRDRGIQAVYVLDEAEYVAREFGRFVSAEIDPAVVVPVSSALAETLAWWRDKVQSP